MTFWKNLSKDWVSSLQYGDAWRCRLMMYVLCQGGYIIGSSQSRWGWGTVFCLVATFCLLEILAAVFAFHERMTKEMIAKAYEYTEELNRLREFVGMVHYSITESSPGVTVVQAGPLQIRREGDRVILEPVKETVH